LTTSVIDKQASDLVSPFPVLPQKKTHSMPTLSFEERFGFLVEAEWLHRRNKRTERLIKKAAFRFPTVI